IAAILHLYERPRPSLDGIHHVGCGLAYRENVIDPGLLEIVHPEIRQCPVVVPLQLFLVSKNEIHLFHGDEGCRVGLCRAAGDDDARMRVLASRLADGLLRLPHGLARDGAGVEDDCAMFQRAEAGRIRLALHDFGLIGVEPAAEGDDFHALWSDGHQAALSSSRTQTPVWGSKVPENSHSAGPLRTT